MGITHHIAREQIPMPAFFSFLFFPLVMEWNVYNVVSVLS
jgi:hypothetical protein